MTSPSDVHYLHTHQGLDLLVRSPIRHGGAMCWDARGGLLVIDSDGALRRVHPAMGTETLKTGLGQLLALLVDQDDVVCVRPDGNIWFLDTSGRVCGALPHRLTAPVDAVQLPAGFVLMGGESGHREALQVRARRKVLRVDIPDGAIALPHDPLSFAWASDMGLERAKAGEDFAGQAAAPLRLVATQGRVVVGIGRDAVAIWLNDGPPHLIELEGCVAVDATAGGETIVLADDQGDLMLVDGRDLDAPPLTLSTGDDTLNALRIDPRGERLATSGQTVKIWSIDR